METRHMRKCILVYSLQARRDERVTGGRITRIYLLRQHAQLHRHHVILVVLLDIRFLHGITNVAPILLVQRTRLAYHALVFVPPPW